MGHGETRWKSGHKVTLPAALTDSVSVSPEAEGKAREYPLGLLGSGKGHSLTFFSGPGGFLYFALLEQEGK